MLRRNLSERGVNPLVPPEAAEQTADEQDPQAALQRALSLAGEGPPSRVATTTERTITRRGVMWLGQTCNLRCYFCYFLDKIEAKDHPEHAFMPLHKAQAICHTLVERYGNDAIDIQGGEPTIWEPILDLIRYCRGIGLAPTLITNALVLDRLETCQGYKDAGIRDFLVSVHGLGEVHDRVVQRPGAHVRQMKALRNLREVGIPFRFNCVLSKPVVAQLPAIAELAVRTGALVVNFLAFNPFADQAKEGKRSANNVPRYREISAQLTGALDILEAAGVEANVRYLPLCVVEERHRKSMYNYQQLPYDPHEWDYASWSWTTQLPQRTEVGDLSGTVPISTQRLVSKFRAPAERLMKLPVIGPAAVRANERLGELLDGLKDKDALYRQNARTRAEVRMGYQKTAECQACSVRTICDGFHRDYFEMFGMDDARAIRLPAPVDDPRHYIRAQSKVVDG
jgi:sulfatase maturation enzyme AslB (radical SAM superfamily)